MRRAWLFYLLVSLSPCLLVSLSTPVRADSFAAVADDVNQKLVKVFGSGGYRGLASYGTGLLVSSDGLILTVASQMLDTPDLRVHLPDGRRYHAQVIATEPELDVALIKIKEKVADLPFFDLPKAAQKPVAAPGTGVLAFSNVFQIATGDEPMTIQQGVIAAYAKLPLRRGIYEAPYSGEVYVIDAITCGPGAGGGIITTRKGELLGLIGKELRNNLTDTWINYAVPIQARATGQRGASSVTVSIVEVVEKKDKYRPLDPKDKGKGGQGGYHGIVLVPNVVERTPPYVEDVIPGSPAAKAGLKPDDLIVYIDGVQMSSVKAFREMMDKVPPKTTLKLEVRRGDKLTSIDLTLEEPVVKVPVKKP